MISLNELKEWIGVTDTSKDNILQDLEIRAVAFLERQTDRYFGPEKTFVEVLDGKNKVILWLREPPTALTSVEVRDQLTTGWETVPATEYELEGRKLMRLVGGGWTGWPDIWSGVWPKGVRNIRITYKFGYPPGQEPGDVRQAVLDLVAHKFRGRGGEAVKSESIGGYSYTMAAVKEVPGVADVLKSWRRGWIG